ncbi:hypothetical protein [Desertibaculum subflavum]|uniref:hypothetical protein n=1 Tax=Desertibaculum subflavum TaxID=2268458 RepID=UPI000E66A556
MAFNNLFNRPRTNVASSILTFPAIDTDGMIKKLRLKERAKDSGQKNLPASDSDAFDATEQQIANEIENEGKTQYNHYLSHQKTYADRASDTGIMALALQVKGVAESATSDFERKTHIGTGDLYAAKRDVIETERELNRFRERHKISRPARDIGSRAYKWGLLVLILAIESVLNGFFLSKGSVFGLVGGIAEALIIAFINIVAGVVVGRALLPWIGYRNWFVRILASLASLAYLAAAVGFNLAVAHYRNAVASDPFEASAAAYRSLVASPFAIDDLQSWSLVLIGLFFSFLAAYDGLRMNDPYPGYGHRMRQNLDALDEYTDRKDELFDQLEEVKKAADARLDDLARSIQSRHSEAQYVSIKSQALREEMRQHFAHLESAANTLLTYYRDENRKARKSPAPPRFEQRWTYACPSLGPDITPSQPADAVQAQIAKLFEDAPKLQEEVNAAYRAALAAYRRIDELVEVKEST